MALLNDADIEKHLKSGRVFVSGWKQEHLNPSSIDLCLGEEFRSFKQSDVTHINPREEFDAEKITHLHKLERGKAFVLHPGDFVLASTKEYIKLPADLAARMDGKSSWGRLGIVVHSTAGTIDPGFEGKLTLEISNVAKIPVCLYPGMRICRLSFEMLSGPSKNPYNKRKDSKYLRQTGVGASKIYLEHKQGKKTE